MLVCLSVKPLVTLKFKNPIKIYTVPILPAKWQTFLSLFFPALLPSSLPLFPYAFSVLVSFPASLCPNLSIPPSLLHVLLSVALYLSLPVSFSVSGPCLVNLEVSLLPSLPPAHPPSMDKHIGRGGRPSGGAAVSVPLPPPRSGQCNTQMDEFPIHPPPAGSPVVGGQTQRR